MNFLAGLGRAVAVLVIIIVCVVLGTFGSCVVMNTAWEPETTRIMAIGAFVGLVLGVVLAILVFRRR